MNLSGKTNMSLQTIDKPNLYFSAQLLINNILAKIAENSIDDQQLHYHLLELKRIFKDNIASTTTHLEAITELTQTYYVCNNKDEIKPVQLVTSFEINAANNTATLQLSPTAVALVKSKDFHIKAMD